MMKRIRARHNKNWFSRLLLVILLAGLWRVFARRSQERIPSPEGIEDPEVAVAFEWVSSMPQMRWIRHFVVSQAARLKDHGKPLTWVVALVSW